MAVELPLAPAGDPFYRVSTQLEDTQYIFDFRWNGRDSAWYMDLLAEDETPIRMGMKLTLSSSPGIVSASAEFPPGAFSVVDTSGSGAEAGLLDLGDRVVVIYYTAAEVAAL